MSSLRHGDGCATVAPPAHAAVALCCCRAVVTPYSRTTVSPRARTAVISKRKIMGTSLVSNVKREVSIMSKLNHPNIVKLHEVLATKTKIYFVLEFVKGGELFAKVSKGSFSEDLARKYFQQLIFAVGYCHSCGVFHRDLK
ncbi:hypothetical protein Ahy_A01g003440 [Arachis hypogaea]|uniref:Protein kinase domain-containing protein n=1 Tax=Arachis hypogaea TaxID=3818 RepID=A0A445ESZ1_ARAHY|nr:hypothetical protein Ahy_A01g003440 [Arachis hypogaea]